MRCASDEWTMVARFNASRCSIEREERSSLWGSQALFRELWCDIVLMLATTI